jgi:phosphatidylserine/phosphatidylglycerophosphate/cardiolipin synthase-like enzyme
MCYPKSVLDCLCCLCPGIYKNRLVDEEEGGEVEDKSASKLSYVGLAAYHVLRKKHFRHHHTLWNVTTGRVQELQATPLEVPSDGADPPSGHDDWFAFKMAELLARTQIWADVMSLGPPDGLFMEQFQQALMKIATRENKSSQTVVIRMMFGHIVGMPVNCTKLIKKLTENLPQDANLHLWVGAWRKGVSWNHAKLVAVDGRYLHTGGHNMWDQHYLKHNPVHDLSIQLEGRIAHDGHRFANQQWAFIRRIQMTCCGFIVDKLPDALELVAKTRVTVSEYPRGQATIFPPVYTAGLIPKYGLELRSPDLAASSQPLVPMISMGRQGTLHWRARPSDDAFVAMLDSAKTIIRMVLQDLGPVCIPGTKITLPGCVWPKAYLSVLGRV